MWFIYESLCRCQCVTKYMSRCGPKNWSKKKAAVNIVSLRTRFTDNNSGSSAVGYLMKIECMRACSPSSSSHPHRVCGHPVVCGGGGAC